MLAEPPDLVDLADRVRLRRPTAADVDALFAVHSDPAVYALDPAERHPDPAYTANWLAPFLEHWRMHGFGYWTVLVPSDWWPDGPVGPAPDDVGRVVAGMGGIRLHRMADGAAADGESVLNVYFRLAPSVHGRGLAGRIVDAAVALSATMAPGSALVVRTRPANSAARRVAERAGFVDLGADPAEPGMRLLRLPAPAVTAPVASRT